MLANATACVVFIIEIIAESRHNYILILIAAVVAVAVVACILAALVCFYFAHHHHCRRRRRLELQLGQRLCSSLGAVGLYSIVFMPSTRGS